MAKGRKLTDEEKKAKAEAKQTPEGLQAELAKLREKEAKLLADLAIKQHPELESGIQTITNFLQELEKADGSLKLGTEASVEQERARLQKQIEFYQNKIDAIKESLAKADAGTIIAQLKESRKTALVNLRRAVDAVNGEFTSVGVTIDQLIPTISKYQTEIDALPASSPTA